MKPTAILALALAFLAAVPAPGQQQPPDTTTGTEKTYNPDPDPCCECITMKVEKQKHDIQGNVPVIVTVTHTGATDCPESIDFTVSPHGLDAPAAVPDQDGTVAAGQSVTLTFLITPDQTRICEDWEFTLTCQKSDAYCDRQIVTLGPCGGDDSSCSDCDGESAEPNASQPEGPGNFGSGDSLSSSLQDDDVTLSATFPTTRSNGGMSDGSMRFVSRNFTFPGRAGLITNISPNFTRTDSLGGILSKVQTNAGLAEIEVTDGPGLNAFTITHRDPVGFAFRTTVVSWITAGGAQTLRMDSTYDGATTRYEQTQPQPGTLVLLKGRVTGTTFVPLLTDTLIRTESNGLRIYHRTVETRASGSHAWKTVSDTQTTWQKQIFGWAKTKEVIHPNGAALTSTWTYYQPGDFPPSEVGISTGGFQLNRSVGRVRHHIRYDGYEAFYTYGLFSRSVTTPYAGNPAGKTTTSIWDAASMTQTITTRVGDHTLSKTVRKHGPGNTLTVDEYTATGAKLTTFYSYKESNFDFGGKSASAFHPDGTLTTYSYTRNPGGGYTTIMDKGARDLPNGTTVTKGTRTTTTRNSRGTVILSKTEAIDYPGATGLFSSMAVTAVDNLGRALTTAHHSASPSASGEQSTAPSPAYTTATAYSCCGISSETDMYGVKTFHAYDGLRRRVKSNTLGVTMETVYDGLTTEIHRYAESVDTSLSSGLTDNDMNLVSSSYRNLAGTLRESGSPDPTPDPVPPLAPGVPRPLVITKSEITYKPAAGLSMRQVTTTPDNFTQTADSFLDGRTSRTTGALSPAMLYAYSVNPTGEQTSRSYLDGANLRETTTSQSDWAGRTLRIDYMGGAFATMAYNSLGQMTKSTDPDGVSTLYAYNSRGERTVTANDLNGNGAINYGTDTVQSSETVPAIGTIGAYTGAVWKTISKVWQDGQSDPTAGTIVSTSMSSPDGLRSSSQTIGVANPSTSLTTLSGGGNWTTTQTSPDNTYSVATYVDGRMDISRNFAFGGALISSTSMRDASNTPLSGYDDWNRPTHRRDSRTGVSTTAYLSSTADIVKSVTDPGSRTTNFTNDVRGRQITVDAPDSVDADNNQLLNVTNTAYNPDGTVQETSGAQTYRNTHIYDYAQRQLSLTTYGTATATTTWKYSTDRGFLTEKNHPGETDNGIADADYTYTAAGRLLTRTWERGVTTTYGYDNGGRQTSIDYSDSTPDVTITYGALNRPEEVTRGTSTWGYAYDLNTLRLLAETHPLGGTSTDRLLTRSYDNLSRPDGFTLGTLTEPALDHSVGYGFDDAGRLGTVTGAGRTFQYTYTANSGYLIGTVAGPEHTVTNTWETDRNALHIKKNEVASATVSQYTYGVNEIGQRDGVETAGSAFGNTDRGWAWGYDSLGQATKAVNTADTALNRAYAFDGIGNRTSATDGSGGTATTVGYTPNALNQFEAINPGTAVNPTYDADGNLRNDAGINALTYGLKYEWDAENRLIAVRKADDTLIATYTYDHMSRRIRKTTTADAYQGASDTAYLYDGWNVVAEYSITGGSTVVLVQAYTWGLDLSGSKQGAGGVGGMLSIHRGPGTDGNNDRTWTDTFYPTYDGNGNVSEYLDKNGAEAAHFEYDPFGRLAATTGTPVDFTYRFSTKPQDFETGLYYYGYRFYDPNSGRWQSRDPIEEEGGVNLYSFITNDPYNSYDILGLRRPTCGQIEDNYLSYGGGTDGDESDDFEAGDAYDEAGGGLDKEFDAGNPNYQDSCALRMSLLLNILGGEHKLVKGDNGADRNPGGNGDRQIIRARDMCKHLRNEWGEPDLTTRNVTDVNNLDTSAMRCNCTCAVFCSSRHVGFISGNKGFDSEVRPGRADSPDIYVWFLSCNED